METLKVNLIALGGRHIRQSDGKMAEKWRSTEDFYDYSGLKDERGNQNWGPTGFMRCKVICKLEIAERCVVECGINKAERIGHVSIANWPQLLKNMISVLLANDRFSKFGYRAA